MISFENKHIMVVGGSRGIGAATVSMLHKAGAKVSVVYRSRRDALDKLIAACGGNDRIEGYQADVIDLAGMDKAVEDSVAKFGKLNGVVVSAGIFEGETIGDMSEEFWDRTLDINLKGTFISVKAANDNLEDGASIVIITSTAGQRGSDIYSAYATSKGGQIMFMRSMARELAPRKIRVNCVAPAWTDTDMAAPSLDEMGRQETDALFPLGRVGKPDDVAGAISYLLSDLSVFVTGITLTVDGGMDMRG